MNHKRVAIVVRQYRRFLYLLVAVSLVLGVVGPAQVLPVQRVQAQGGVTLDGAVSSDTADGVSTIDVVHTTGTGVNRLMLVGVSANSYNAARTISSVTFTYDTTELTLVEVGSVENEAGRLAAIYGLVDPPSGQAGTVTVTFSGAVNYGIVAGVVNFAEVDQTTPFGTFASATGQSTAPSVDLTGLDGSELVFDTAFVGAATIPAVTVGADQTERWNASVDRTGGVASTEQATGGSVTMSWTTGTTSVYWSIAAVPINPAPVGPTYDLTMAVNPGGGGTTSPADGVTHAVPQDTDVDITATANVGYAFANWIGTGVADPNSPNTTVHVDGDKTVTANFTALDQYALTVGTTGDGSVTLDPAGGTYYEGTTVTLTPVAGPCYAFSGWSGTNYLDLTDNGDGTWSITMDEDKSVTADFGALSQYTLTAGDDGHGSVTLDPAGGTYCTGTTVTLTPVPDSGYIFSSWSGSNAGDLTDNGDGTWSILMNENKSVTANFAVYVPPTVDGAASSNTADDVDSIDIAHTTGTGADRLMLVGVSWNCGSTDRTITSVTFTPSGGSASILQEVWTQLAGSTESDPRYSAIYSLLNPPSGVAGTVTVNFSGDVSNGIVAGVANFAGVDQANPLGTPNGDSTTSGDAPTVTLDGLSGDELVFDNVFQGASGETQTLTAGTDQTRLWHEFAGNARGAASTKEAASASSVTMSWTAASSAYWAIAAVPINPASAGVTCYALTLDHTGQGSDPVASPTSSTGCDAGQYVADQTINLSGADPDDGWGIASWYGTGDDTSTADTNSVTMPPSAHSAGVNYLRLLGDVDLSGDVDSTDALIVLTADAGLDTTDYCPLNYGDVNSDGVVNSTDALIMLTYDVGLPVGGLPVGQPVVEPVLSNQPPGCIIP